MELIIDFDKIKDPSKKEWLITSLKLMHIGFQTSEKPQTLTQYNNELENAEIEIEQRKSITAIELKKESINW